jgi:pyridoxamine 5'-phosphate oxidase-like protein
MSVCVEVEDLAAHVAERGTVAYLCTTGADGRPHTVAVALETEPDGGAALRCDAGNRSVANAAARPLVALLWPARDASDFSLIVDGDAAVVGEGDARRVVVTPTRAVLHRPAAATVR